MGKIMDPTPSKILKITYQVFTVIKLDGSTCISSIKMKEISSKKKFKTKFKFLKKKNLPKKNN